MTGKISRRMSWFLQVTASTVKQACTALMKKHLGQCRLLRKPVAANITGRLTVASCQRFIFQHAAKVTQQWVATHCPDFIDKDSWPPNSPDINPLDYHVWGLILEKFCHLNSRPKDIPELKSALMKIWSDLHKPF